MTKLPKEENGGYYAIKGFAYQVDKAILEALTTTNQNTEVGIERIQDIDTDSYVIQVKYRETQVFTPSKIKEPVIQLLNEFSNKPSKTYILYAYYGDLNNYESFIDINKRLSLENLDKILGNMKKEFESDLKKAFIEKFILEFSNTFQNQFEQIIKKLQELDFIGNSKEEAMFYYANIAKHIEQIVTNTYPESISERKFTKSELLTKIKDGKQLVFNTAFEEYLGYKNYYKFIKQKFVKPKKNMENIIFFGDVNTDSASSLSTIISDITQTYFYKATYDIKPPTFIILDKDINNVKKELLKTGISFNDGYEAIEFDTKSFFSQPIKCRKTLSNRRISESLKNISYKIRLISLETFRTIADLQPKPQMQYYFDSCESIKFPDVPFQRLENVKGNDVPKLFK